MSTKRLNLEREYILIDKTTGEAIDFKKGLTAYFYDKYEIDKRSKQFVRFGNFTFAIFEPNSVLFELSPASLTRVMYLSTFMNYDNAICFDTERPTRPHTAREYWTRYDFLRELGVNENTARALWKELEKFGIIYKSEDNGRLYLSSKYFRKGKINKEYFKNPETKVCRIYQHAMRELYQASTQNHATLGYVLRLAPYLHKKYNVLCFNPDEPDPKKIDPLKVRHLTIGTDYLWKNNPRLFHRMTNITFTTKQGVESKLLVNINFDFGGYRNKKKYILVHPCLIYGGSDIEDVYHFCDDLIGKRRDEAENEDEKGDNKE